MNLLPEVTASDENEDRTEQNSANLLSIPAESGKKTVGQLLYPDLSPAEANKKAFKEALKTGAMGGIGGLGGNLLRAGEGIPALTRLAGGAQHGLGGQILNLLGMGAKNAAIGTTAMGAENAIEGKMSSPEDYLKNALLSGAGGAALGGIESGINAARPSQFLRGNLSPEELQKNLNVSRGTSTGLGDVIQSPLLKETLENQLTKIPGSGAYQQIQKTGEQVASRGENILSNLIGQENPEKTNEKLINSLENVYNSRNLQKRELYKEVENIAEKSKVRPNLENFEQTANKYIDTINSTNVLKFNPETKSLLNKLSSYQDTFNIRTDVITGKPIQEGMPSLQEALLLKADLNKLSNKFKYSQDSNERGSSTIFGHLASSLKKDISSTVESSGNKELQEALINAEDNYKKNFSPLLDKDILRVIGGKIDPDTFMQKFVINSKKSDRAKQVNKIMDLLPEEQKNLMGYGYLSSSINKKGEIDLGKMQSLIKALGNRQFKALFPNKEMRDQLQDFSTLKSMNSESFSTMVNPKTGHRVSNIIMGSLPIAGGIHGYMLGGVPGSMAGAAAGALAPGMIAKPLVNLLTSPQYREKLIKEMIKNKRFKLPSAAYGLQAAAQGENNGN